MGKLLDFIEDYNISRDLDQFEQRLKSLKLEELVQKDQQIWFCNMVEIQDLKHEEQECYSLATQAIERYPEITRFHFYIANILEKRGEIDNAIHHFHQMRIEENGVQRFLRAARICYLWNRCAEGLSFLEPVFQKYHEIKIVDDHYLHMNGFPFYTDSFAHLAVLAKEAQDLTLVNNEIDAFQTLYHDHAQEENIKRLWTAFVTGDWSPILDPLEKEYQEDPDLLIQFDHFVLAKYAILKSRTILEWGPALAVLDEVECTDGDFSWLPYAILLSKGELAARFQKFEEEEKYLQPFIKAYPSLFSLNLVFTFGFDTYQKKLKKRYREARA